MQIFRVEVAELRALASVLAAVGKDRPAGWIPQRESPGEQAVSRTSVLSQLA